MATGWCHSLDPGCFWSGPHSVFVVPKGRFDKTLKHITLASCKASCESETGFKCISFRYKLESKECNLIRANRTEVKFNEGWDHVMFKIVCDTEGTLNLKYGHCSLISMC